MLLVRSLKASLTGRSLFATAAAVATGSARPALAPLSLLRFSSSSPPESDPNDPPASFEAGPSPSPSTSNGGGGRPQFDPSTRPTTKEGWADLKASKQERIGKACALFLEGTLVGEIAGKLGCVAFASLSDEDRGHGIGRASRRLRGGGGPTARARAGTIGHPPQQGQER